MSLTTGTIARSERYWCSGFRRCCEAPCLPPMSGFEMFCERCGKRYGSGEATAASALPLTKRLLKAVGLSTSAPQAAGRRALPSLLPRVPWLLLPLMLERGRGFLPDVRAHAGADRRTRSPAAVRGAAFDGLHAHRAHRVRAGVWPDRPSAGHGYATRLPSHRRSRGVVDLRDGNSVGTRVPGALGDRNARCAVVDRPNSGDTRRRCCGNGCLSARPRGRAARVRRARRSAIRSGRGRSCRAAGARSGGRRRAGRGASRCRIRNIRPGGCRASRRASRSGHVVRRAGAGRAVHRLCSQRRRRDGRGRARCRMAAEAEAVEFETVSGEAEAVEFETVSGEAEAVEFETVSGEAEAVELETVSGEAEAVEFETVSGEAEAVEFGRSAAGRRIRRSAARPRQSSSRRSAARPRQSSSRRSAARPRQSSLETVSGRGRGSRVRDGQRRGRGDRSGRGLCSGRRSRRD